MTNPESYCFRFVSSLNTSYASAISFKVTFRLAELFLSGCHFKASLRYALTISFFVADFLILSLS